MFVVINRDGSISTIAPSNVYQGSNAAAALGIFAPFSVTTYPLVSVNAELPSGKWSEPLIAAPAAEQPHGFGAWTLPLPTSVTALSGVVRFSFEFRGANEQVVTTEPVEVTVTATVPANLPETPSGQTYQELLQAISSLAEALKANWTQADPSGVGYILNKPNVKSGEGVGSVIIGNDSTAEGQEAVALNHGNQATGDYSFASGAGCVAKGDYSFSGGNNSRSLGGVSFSFGYEANSKKGSGISIGVNIDNNAEKAVCLGESLKALESAVNAVVLGLGLTAVVSQGVVLGKFNDENSTAFFQLGAGSSEDDRKNILEIYEDGNMKVSKITPFSPSDSGNFTVVGDSGELVAVELTIGGEY